MRARKTGWEFALVAVLISAAALLLQPYIEKEQAKTRAADAEWIRERIAADRAYEREVEAERARWAAIEEAGGFDETMLAEIAYATEMEKINAFNDPDILDEVEEAARKWGEVYNISPEFLEAVAWRESRYDPEAVNGGCVGLMQVAPVWHGDRMERLGVEDLTEVDGNMAVAADYLAELFATYNDPYWVLMTYNGDSNADAYRSGNAAPSMYALEITEKAFEFTQIHEEGGSGQ